MQAYKCDEQDLIEVPKVYTLCVYTNQQKQNYTVKKHLGYFNHVLVISVACLLCA